MAHENGNGPRAVIPPRDRLTAARPAKTGATPSSVSLGAARRRRQAASARMGLLPCGACTDPLRCGLARWCPVFDGPRPEPGLTAAADHLDGLGLCACWAVPRRHREAS
jgi:hypothetical protein